LSPRSGKVPTIRDIFDPVSGDRRAAAKEGQHRFMVDVSDGSVIGGLAEGPEHIAFATEPMPQGALVRQVGGDNV
jgi:hypothetical protein